MYKPFSNLIFENFSLRRVFKLILRANERSWRVSQSENWIWKPPSPKWSSTCNCCLNFSSSDSQQHDLLFFEILYFRYTSGTLSVNFEITFGLLPVYFRYISGINSVNDIEKFLCQYSWGKDFSLGQFWSISTGESFVSNIFIDVTFSGW